MSIDTLLKEAQAAHAKTGEALAELVTSLTLPQIVIELRPGEDYAGLVLGDDGKPSHHLILLPGEVEGNWNDAIKAAGEAGGELPTRREQSMLFANLKSKFKAAWYWSSEQYSESSAWGQDFYDGLQLDGGKSAACRARFVRRLPL